jgi:hypothetical protein
MFAAILVSWDIAVSEVSGYVLTTSACFRSRQELYLLVSTFRVALEPVQRTPDGVAFVGESVRSLKQILCI